MAKIKYLLFALVTLLAGAPAAFAAALDTSKFSDITSSLDTASAWLSGPVTTAIVGIIVGAIIIAIVKFAGKKARP